MRQKRTLYTLLSILLILLMMSGCNPPVDPGAPTALTDEAKASLRVFASTETVDGLDGYWYRHTEDAYEYPFTADTHPEEWKEADSLYRHEAQNLPADVLASISTSGLVETCFNNSFFIDFSVASGGNYHLSSMDTFESFNSGTELLARPDAAAALIDYYQSIHVEKLYQIASGALRLRYIEYVIADDRFIQAMSAEQRADLLHAVMANVQSRDRLTTLEINFMSSALLAGKLLMADSDAFRTYLAAEDQVKAYLTSGEMSPDPMGYGYRGLIDRLIPFIAY